MRHLHVTSISWMIRRLSSCGITLAVLLGSRSHHSITLASGLGPFGRTSVAFALPSLCAAAYHQYCPFRRRRQRPMAHIFNDGTGSSSRGESGVGGAGAAATEGCRIARRAVGSGLDRDAEHMRRALELAAKGLGRTRPNPAVGCVIVDKDGLVVGEGFHPRAGEPHAEVWAIREAGARAKGGTAYVTLEPCNHFGRTPPCTMALLDSGVSRVVAGMVDPDPRTAGSGLRRLADQGLDVSVGVEGAACQALNSPFVHRVSEKSCYGVLHCSLGEPESLELEDTLQEAGLTVPPDRHSYEEYDAIVVEGRSGVAKLAACLHALPPTAFRVVLVSSSEGVEGELGPVLESGLWSDVPERTLVFVAAASEESKEDSSGPVRASLSSRGVGIVEFSPRASPHTETGPNAVHTSEGDNAAAGGVAAAAAASAIARELYRRGLLLAAWEVGPEMAARALKGGHIQRALVRRRRGGSEAGLTVEGSHGKSCAPVDGAIGREEEEEVVLAMRRIYGKEGVRLRGEGVSPGREGAKQFTEVLLPVADYRPPASG